MGKHCHGNLGADRIFGCAKERHGLQRLFDPAEEQLAFSAGLMEAGDDLGWKLEIVRHATRQFACIDDVMDLAQIAIERILACVTKLTAQTRDAVCNDRSGFQGVMHHEDFDGGFSSQPYDETAARHV